MLYSSIYLAVLTLYFLSRIPLQSAQTLCTLKDSDYCGGENRQFSSKSSVFSNLDLENTYASWNDLNQDGLLDLIVTYQSGHSNNGTTYLFKNLGNSTNPQFLNEELLWSIDTDVDFNPGFGDLDGDGDLDAVLSFGADKALQLWMNIGNASTPLFVQQMNSTALEKLDSSDYSAVAPTLVDLDQDGDLDMAFVQDNSFLLYENSGNSTQAVFGAIGRFKNPMNVLSGSETEDVHFYDLDKDGDYDMFVGGKAYVQYYENHGSPQSAIFKSSSETLVDVSYYDEPLILVGDINGDDLPELLVLAGDITGPTFHQDYFTLDISNEADFTVRSEANDDPFSDIYLLESEKATVAAADLDGDGDVDLLLGSETLGLTYYENVGNTTFKNHTLGYRGLYAAKKSANPAVGDLDGDGDIDVVVAVGTEDIGTYAWIYHENKGDEGFEAYAYGQAKNPFNGLNKQMNETSQFVPTLFDLDDDGDLDLIYGTSSYLVTYWNVGNRTSPSFETEASYSIWKDGIDADFPSSPKPAFVYLDGKDETLYFVTGYKASGLYCYADKSAMASLDHPLFDLGSEDSDCSDRFSDLGTFHSAIAFVDMDNDGDEDLIVGTSLGLVQYMENGFCTLTSECSGQGFCNIYQWDPTCTCEENQAGNQCEECAEGYYGVDCTKCPVDWSGVVCSQRGVCSDGIEGTGECSCNDYLSGTACGSGTCPAGYGYELNTTTYLYECNPCEAQKYKAVAGNSECLACPNGFDTSVEEQGMTECSCQKGYYWSLDNSTGVGSCIDCASVISLATSSSVTTASSGATTENECICTMDYYKNHSDCVTCRDTIEYGVNCVEGSDLATFTLRSGYWRVAPDSATILKCPLGSVNCAGGTGYIDNSTTLPSEYFDADYYCTDRYQGPYCSVCRDGYFKSVSAKCIQCQTSLKIVGYIGIVLTAILVLLCVWYLFIHDRDPPEEADKTSSDQVHSPIYSTSPEQVVQVLKSNVAWTSAKKKKGTVVPGRDDSAGSTAQDGFTQTQESKATSEREKSDHSGANLLDEAPQKAKNRAFLHRVLFLDKGLQAVQASLIDGAEEDEIIAAIRSKVKILLVCHQILVQFPSILSVDLPGNFSNYLDGMDFVNLDIASIISWTCMANTTFYQQLLAMTILPLVACSLIFVVYMVHDYFSPRTDLRERYMQIFYAMTFIMFGTCSTKVFQTFLCDHFDDGSSYLKADYSVSCDTEIYEAYFIYACFMLVVYPIGIPILYAVELYRHRHDIIAYKYSLQEEEEEEENLNKAAKTLEKQSSEAFYFPDKMSSLLQKYNALLIPAEKQETLTQMEAIVTTQKKRDMMASTHMGLTRLGSMRPQPKQSGTKYLKFLYEPYGVHCWWFAIAECIRRLTLSGLLVFFNTNTTAQVIIAVILAVFWLLVFVKVSPYQEAEDNYLEQYVGVIIFITMFAALMVGVEVTGADTEQMLIVGIVLVTLDGAVLIFGLIYFLSFYFYPKMYRLFQKYKRW